MYNGIKVLLVSYSLTNFLLPKLDTGRFRQTNVCISSLLTVVNIILSKIKK
jgi:hypothetical protein